MARKTRTVAEQRNYLVLDVKAAKSILCCGCRKHNCTEPSVLAFPKWMTATIYGVCRCCKRQARNASEK